MQIISVLKWRHGHDVFEGEKLMFSLKAVKNVRGEMGVIGQKNPGLEADASGAQ